MRLLTAIPLLFWTSTAAIAHLAVILAAQPCPAVTHARSAEPSVSAATQHTSALSAESRFAAAVYSGVSLSSRLVFRDPAPLAEQPFAETGSSCLTLRILQAARLSANPPPEQA